MVHFLSDKVASLPAEYAEIRVDEAEVTAIHVVGREIETIGTNLVFGGAVRVYDKGRWGFVSFNSLDRLDACVEQALAHVHSLDMKKGALRIPGPVRDTVRATCEINPADVPLSDKAHLCTAYNTRMLESHGIETASVRYRDINGKRHFVSSAGTAVTQENVNAGIMMLAHAKDGATVQQAYRSFGESAGFELVTGREADADDVVKDVRDLLNAPKIEGGRYTVIMDQRLAGVFAHEAFGHMSEADFISRNPDFQKKMVLGTRFGPEFLSIIDDGTVAGARGYYAYDDEGVPSQKTWLIKNGLLHARLHSMETAADMDEPLSGNARAISYRFPPIVRMSCTYIDAGTVPFEEMIAPIKDGIYAIGMLGGNTDLEMFTFSSEKAYHIRNGRLDGLIRDVILSGNVFETLNAIDAVGNDLRLHGGMGGCGKAGQSPLPVSDGGPHIRVKNVLVG